METDKTLQEVTSEFFKPNDFVRVINIDNEPFEWNYCADEEIFQDQIYRRVLKRKIDTYRLEPGESQVLEGGCARIMVESLFKKVAPKRESLKHRALGVNAIQRQYLSEIVVGIENPFAKPVNDVTAEPHEINQQDVEAVEQEFAQLQEEVKASKKAQDGQPASKK